MLISRFGAPLLALLFWMLGWPEDIPDQARITLAITIWMSIWWVSDAVPMAVTALLPTLIFPLTGVMGAKETAQAYAHPMLFVFLGGFLVAKAMETVGLHKRIALGIVLRLGGSPSRVLLGFILATATLSAWISNTATTVLMAPLAMATAAYLGQDEQGRPASLPLLLGIAYAASIGGLATLIGTPTNGIFASVVSDRYGIEFGFAEWLKIGFPVVVLLIAGLYFYLSRVSGLYLRKTGDSLQQVRHAFAKLDIMQAPERSVLIVFIVMAILWSTRPLYQPWIPLTDAGIAVFGATILFLLPGNMPNGRLIDWPTASTVPWGVLVLFAGGLALAEGFSVSGLATYLGSKLAILGDLPFPLVLLIIVAFVNFLTEVTSNVATASVLLPVIASMAEQTGQDPVMLMAAATLAASCAFMLPVATAPNAIVFGSGELTVAYMAKRGFALNVISILVITGWIWFLS